MTRGGSVARPFTGPCVSPSWPGPRDFCSRHLTSPFIIPSSLHTSLSNVPRVTRVQIERVRINARIVCIRSRKKKEEASIIYRVENIEKATKRDERQKEGAARAPSFPLLPSLSLHDPSPLLLPAREDVREI